MNNESRNGRGDLALTAIGVLGGILALWENEGRFDYSAAAHDAEVISSHKLADPDRTIAITDALKTDIRIEDSYVEPILGYHIVERTAEIYSWHHSTGENSKWTLDWYTYLESNTRNSEQKKLIGDQRSPAKDYQLGELKINPANIHFADSYQAIQPSSLRLGAKGEEVALEAEGGAFYKRVGARGTDTLGDERITYSGIPNAATATYFGLIADGVGVGKNFEIETSIISSLIKNDGILHHIVNGEHDQALATVASDYSSLMWMVRLGGTLAIMIGIYTALSSLVNLLYGIPLLGQLVRGGVLLVSAVLGLVIALITIVTSLIVHHPVFVALPLLLAIGAYVALRMRSKQAKENAGQTLSRMTATMASERDAADGGSETGSDAVENALRNLAAMAAADGKLDKREQKFLVRWGEQHGLSKQQVETLFKQQMMSKQQPKVSSRDDLVVITCLALADGRISTKELRLLRSLGTGLGMTNDDMQSMILEVESAA
ncbi:MAG: hypothetical protein ACI9SE_001962 [Neolewinella sp.]|jgi:DnaJ-domain-containing protein 1